MPLGAWKCSKSSVYDARLWDRRAARLPFEKRVGGALVADRGLGAVAGQDDRLVRQRQALVGQAAQDLGVVAARQVRSGRWSRRTAGRRRTSPRDVLVRAAGTSPTPWYGPERGRPTRSRPASGSTSPSVSSRTSSGSLKRQAAEASPPGRRRPAPGRVGQQVAVLGVDPGRNVARAADRGDRPQWSMWPWVSSTATGLSRCSRSIVDLVDGVLAWIDDHALLARCGRDDVAVGLEGPCGEAGDEHLPQLISSRKAAMGM